MTLAGVHRAAQAGAGGDGLRRRRVSAPRPIMRLKMLEAHRRAGRLDADLRWTREAGPMNFHDTPLAGAKLIELEKRGDERGFFARMFCEREFAAAGLETRFVNINNSLSATAGTLRGLHYQIGEAAEVKVVRCVRGALVRRDRRSAAGFADLSAAVRRNADRRQPADDVCPARLRSRDPHAGARHRGALSRQRPLCAAGRARAALERSALCDPPGRARPPEISAKDAGWPDFDAELSRRRAVEGVRVKVLFTGASSFTGFWFVGRLAAVGRRGDGAAARERRTATLACAPSGRAGCRNGRRSSRIARSAPSRFLDLIRARDFDVICHHAAEARDYRSAGFRRRWRRSAPTLATCARL